MGCGDSKVLDDKKQYKEKEKIIKYEEDNKKITQDKGINGLEYEKINIKSKNSNNGEISLTINNNNRIKGNSEINIINNKNDDSEINKKNSNIYNNIGKDNKKLKESYNDNNIGENTKKLKNSYNDNNIEKDIKKLKNSYNDNNIEKDSKKLKDSYKNNNDDKMCDKYNNSEDKNKTFNNNINSRNDKNQIINNNEINNEGRPKGEYNDEKNNELNEQRIKEEKEEEEDEEKKFKNNLKILLINLEAKHVNIEEIKEKINVVLQDLFDEDSSYEQKLCKLVEKTTKIFEEVLKLNNSADKKKLTEIINSVNKEKDIESFKDYIFAILENYIDFANLKKDIEKIIKNYIYDFMKGEMMKNKKDELIKKYNKKDYIITYDMFNKDIVLEKNEEKIFMDNNAVEYLLYLMKKSIIDKKNDNCFMEDLDLQIFLNFYNNQKDL